MNIIQEQILTELESQWCNRMTELVQYNMIEDSDALFSEYVVDGMEPFEQEWVFMTYYKSIQ
jgi:hypothetical protein